MLTRILSLAGITALAAGTLLADFSYQETSTITGGAIAGMMKVAGVFSKQAREPIQSTVAVKGNRLMHRTALHASIIDLDKETITEIDLNKKTYSVVTFAQMKQMMDEMARKMKEKDAQGQMNFKVSANGTGKQKQISGYDAKETVVNLELQGTDQQTGQTSSMVIATDLWLARGISGYNEIRDFYKRMAEKIDWTPTGNMFMSRPDVAKGMAEVNKQSALLEGVPVVQSVAMGGPGTTAPDASEPPQQKQKEKPKVGSALGGAIGGHFGLHRKNSDDDQQQQQQQAGQPSGPGSLLEMRTESSGFSAAPVDPAQFDIPAGFKQVDADARRMQ